MELISQWLSNLLSITKTFEFKDLIDIIAISFVVYNILKIVQETRASQLIRGLLLLLVAYFFSSLFELSMLTYLLKTFFEFSVILLVIIFQPELRKALERIGTSKVSNKSIMMLFSQNKNNNTLEAQKKAISDVSDVAIMFSHSKTGALIVFERNVKLSDIASTGTILDCLTSVSIFGNIFFNKAPLHDGACIIRDGLIHSAGCILPLTNSKNVDSNLGTRHRASLGMSEYSDAIVLVVSEETGTISIANSGVLEQGFDRNSLHKRLTDLVIGENEEKDLLSLFSKMKRSGKDND